MPTPEEIEKAKAVAAAVEAQFKMKDHHNYLRNARLVLLGLVFAEILLGLWRGYVHHLTLDMYIEFVFSAIFLGAWLISRTYPTPALLVALVIYVLPQILFLVVMPMLFFSGLIWKIIIIIALSMGLRASIKIPRRNTGTHSEVLDDPTKEDEVI